MVTCVIVNTFALYSIILDARGCATQIITTIKQAESQLQHRKTQLKEKEPFLVSYKDDYQTQKIMYDNMNKELEQIQVFNYRLRVNRSVF